MVKTYLNAPIITAVSKAIESGIVKENFLINPTVVAKILEEANDLYLDQVVKIVESTVSGISIDFTGCNNMDSVFPEEPTHFMTNFLESISTYKANGTLPTDYSKLYIIWFYCHIYVADISGYDNQKLPFVTQMHIFNNSGIIESEHIFNTDNIFKMLSHTPHDKVDTLIHILKTKNADGLTNIGNLISQDNTDNIENIIHLVNCYLDNHPTEADYNTCFATAVYLQILIADLENNY